LQREQRLAKFRKTASVFLKEKKMCYKILNFAIRLGQSLGIALDSLDLPKRKTAFSKGGLAAKGLIEPQFILSMFLFFDQILASCFYKNCSYKKMCI